MRPPIRAKVLSLSVVAAAAMNAQTDRGEYRIEKLDPALDELVPAGTTIETLSDRFALTESPA